MSPGVARCPLGDEIILWFSPVPWTPGALHWELTTGVEDGLRWVAFEEFENQQLNVTLGWCVFSNAKAHDEKCSLVPL